MPLRAVFREELAKLTGSLVGMCELAGATMDEATRALLDSDLAAAERVISRVGDFTHLSGDAEDAAVRLLALQAPVAGDLRVVVSSLQNIADAQRMGALALHIAKAARRRHPAPAVPAPVSPLFNEMGRLAVAISTAVREVLATSDPYRAAQLRHDDDAMDDLHRHLFTLLLEREWEHGVAAAVDVTLLSRYYERFADHAVAIGRRVIFQATGHVDL